MKTRTLLSIPSLFLTVCNLAGLMPQKAGAAQNISFSDSWADKAINSAVYEPFVQTTGSYKLQISVAMTGEDITTFSTGTSFSLNVGPNLSINHALGDDLGYVPGKKSATFQDMDPNTGLNISTAVSWTANSISVVESENGDALGGEFAYGTPGTAGPTTISDTYDVNIAIDVFYYDDPNVAVTGKNTDVENVADGLSLETGSITGTADFTPPALTLSSPANNTKIFTPNSIVTLTGAASDNVSLDSVWCYVNGDTNDQPTQLADFTGGAPLRSSSWSNTLDLTQAPGAALGPNIISVYAQDSAGNQSLILSRTVLWVEVTSVSLAINPAGAGSVTGISNGESVTVGQSYSLKAIAANKGWTFLDWTDDQGDVLSSNLSFVYVPADTNVTEVADSVNGNFVANPFSASATYTGLFFDPQNVTPTNAGYVTITVTSQGAFTGKLLLGKPTAPYALSGQFYLPSDFDPQGDNTANADIKVPFDKTGALDVSLQLNLDTNLTDAGAASLSGQVNAFADKLETEPLWPNPAAVSGELSDYTGNPPLGHYNLILPPAGADSSQGPGGFSYGSATVGKGGTVSLVLNLADGTSPAISFSSALAQDGSFPFFASLYNGNGIILGWLIFTNDTGNAFAIEGNNVWWVKLPVPGKFYADGFGPMQGAPTYVAGTEPLIGGSLYTPPKAGANIVGATSLTISFSGGNVLDIDNIPVTFNPKNNTFVTAQSPNVNRVTLTFAPSTGALSGTFVPAAGQKAIAFKGVFLPESGVGYGSFTGASETGQFSLSPSERGASERGASERGASERGAWSVERGAWRGVACSVLR